MRKPKSVVSVHIALVLALSSLLFSRGAIAEDTQPGALPNDSPSNGLVVVIENKPDRPSESAGVG